MTHVLYIYSAGSPDIYWHNVQLPFSFQESSSSEKAASPFSRFWDISAQDYCDADESSNIVVIEKYTIIFWFPIW